MNKCEKCIYKDVCKYKENVNILTEGVSKLLDNLESEGIDTTAAVIMIDCDHFKSARKSKKEGV